MYDMIDIFNKYEMLFLILNILCCATQFTRIYTNTSLKSQISLCCSKDITMYLKDITFCYSGKGRTE